MIPDLAIISKCKDCETIFWVRDFYNNKILNIVKSKFFKIKTQNLQDPDSLNIYDNFQALENGLINGKDQELYIRIQIWWRFNDRIRMNEPIFQKQNDEQLFKDNLLKLRELIPLSGFDNLVRIAEICRNLGEYENCNKYLKSIDDVNYNFIKNVLIKECLKQNPYVIEIVYKQ